VRGQPANDTERLARLGDPPDLAAAHRHGGVRAVDARRQARARAQAQHRVPRLGQPHAREGDAEVVDQPPRDPLQDRVELEHARHLERDAVE
jgi:hypothetical protein